MSDREYKIKITADSAEGVAGAQQTAQALDQVGGATENLGKKTGEATGHVDKHVLSHKQLHKIIHGLNQAVPLLGTFLQAAFSPISATIAVSMMVLELFKEKIKETTEELEKMGEEAAKPMTLRLEAQREATVSAAAEAAKFTRELRAASLAERTLAESTKEAIDSLKSEREAISGIRSAEFEGELAELESLHARGLVSELDFLKKKAQLEYADKERKRREESEDEAAELAIKERTLAAMQARSQQVGPSDAVLATGRAVEADTRLKSLPSEAKLEEQLKAAEAAFEKADKGLDTSHMGQGSARYRLGKFYGGDVEKARTYDPALAGQFDAFERTQQDLDRARRASESAPGIRAGATVAAEAAKDAAAEARRKEIEDLKEQARMAAELERDRTRHDLHEGRRRTVGNIELQTSETRLREQLGAAIEHDPNVGLSSQFIGATTTHGRELNDALAKAVQAYQRLSAEVADHNRALNRDQGQR